MPLFTIGLDRESKQLIRSLIDALNQSNNNEAVLDELQSLRELIMSEATDFAGKVDRLTTEVSQNSALIQSLRDLIAAGAADTELANAVRAGLPAIDAAIAALDANTPEPPPSE